MISIGLSVAVIGVMVGGVVSVCILVAINAAYMRGMEEGRRITLRNLGYVD